MFFEADTGLTDHFNQVYRSVVTIIAIAIGTSRTTLRCFLVLQGQRGCTSDPTANTSSFYCSNLVLMVHNSRLFFSSLWLLF